MKLQSLIAHMISDRKGQIYLVCIITVLSQIITVFMNIANSLIWWRRIDLDLILIGCIDSFIATIILAPAAIYLIKKSLNLDDMNRQLQKEVYERIMMGEALRKSEDKYRTLIETTNTGFVIIDQDGIVQDANAEYVRLAGHSALSEIVGRSVLEWTAEYEKEKNAAAVKSCFDKGYIRNFEIDYVDAKGNITPIEINATCLEVGGKTHTITICRDISARKKIENELQNLAAIVRHSSDLINLSTIDGKMIFLNEAGCGMLGIEPESVKEYSMLDVIPVHLRKRVSTNLFPVLLRGAIWEGELQYKNLKTGSTVDAYATMFAITDPLSRAPLCFANVSRNITDRKQAEDAVRQSEEKYRTILESIDEGYFEQNLAGDFIFLSDSMCRIYGYPKEELLGMNYKQYTDKESGKKCLQVYSNIFKTGQPGKVVDFDIIRKNATRRHIESSVSLQKDSTGKPIAFRGIVRDVTDRKETELEKRNLEERLQRAEKMEALGTLAGGVAHDLNNVLGVIVGYAELLLNEVHPSSPVIPRLTKIMSGSEKAAAIVQDLLTLARRGVPGRKVLNLNKIILDYQNSPELEKLSSYNPAVHITLDLDAHLLNISGSAVHLGKVISNLAANALEAMPKGGALTIKTANQYLDNPIYGYDAVREGDYVVLTVTDTGEGISPADLTRIFEPFYTKKVMGRSGTGLGLAVVWGTMKDHQGYITVRSEEGKGSTFTLYFPVTREELSAEAASASLAEYMGKGETILIVDDVAEQRELASEMLKKLNYNVSSVGSGEEAITYINKNKIDLMVLDMIMEPGIDGLDTYKKVLKIQPKQKAIIVSGFSETERVNEAHALGAGSYLRKPYITEKLGLAVRKELDK